MANRQVWWGYCSSLQGYCSLKVVEIICITDMYQVSISCLMWKCGHHHIEITYCWQRTAQILQPVCKHCATGVLYSGLLIFRGKKTKISRDFQGQIRGKIGRFRGIFAGKKSKFAEQSADFRRFSQEKSQNSQENRPISRDFSGKESIFEGFSGANNFLRIS